jgi:hypothetical protein
MVKVGDRIMAVDGDPGVAGVDRTGHGRHGTGHHQGRQPNAETKAREFCGSTQFRACLPPLSKLRRTARKSGREVAGMRSLPGLAIKSE